MSLEITPNALKKIHSLFESKQDPSLCFRVGILPGGCSGYEYQFKLVQKQDLLPVDQVFQHVYEKKPLSIVINQKSLEILKGACLDHQEELCASRFVITNPNVEDQCGCGISFCIK